ncbi:anthrone oxygenase family protein [Nocardioides pantholopis]|uniref:anthrone oxygenase family protein n=1 Tax=Nocardioides pantholopis TaxID=2483798 RepID=UPI0019D31684|nr:anthrone oxygenase family protein [Nocardioides pantholopis]
MADGMDSVLLAGGRALSGLLAGTYLAFVVAVMPSLRGVSDETFVRVMNRINVVIVNPVFLALFLGAPALAVLLAALRRDPVTIAAAVAAVVALVITFAVNIPLNEALARGGSRDAFESPWVRWHDVRTAAAAVAFVLLCVPGR